MAASPTNTDQQFVQMTDEEAIYQEEVAALEQRGRRLRRAALTAGIFQSVAVVCMIYSTIAVRWGIVNLQQPEQSVEDITKYIGLFKIGHVCDGLFSVAETFVGVLVGLILIGAGVNPATSSLIIVTKVIGQCIAAGCILFNVVAGVLVDENLALNGTMQSLFYSDNMPPIGNQLVYVLLLLNRYGLLIAQVFTGVHFLLLGFTIIMWGVLPRWLGYLLFVAGPSLIVNSLLYALVSGYDGDMSLIFYLPMLAGQLWLAGWLLVNIPHPAKNREFLPNGEKTVDE